MGESQTATSLHGLSLKELEVLRDEVKRAKGQAYCPYSRFPVGCSILLKAKGSSNLAEPAAADAILANVVSGANVENAAYPSGVCAERNAMGAAVFRGLRMGGVRAIFVTTNMKDFCSPCGMCRQFIREFCEPGTPIFMLNNEGNHAVRTLGELLPMAFGPGSLGNVEIE